MNGVGLIDCRGNSECAFQAGEVSDKQTKVLCCWAAWSRVLVVAGAGEAGGMPGGGLIGAEDEWLEAEWFGSAGVPS